MLTQIFALSSACIVSQGVIINLIIRLDIHIYNAYPNIRFDIRMYSKSGSQNIHKYSFGHAHVLYARESSYPNIGLWIHKHDTTGNYYMFIHNYL